MSVAGQPVNTIDLGEGPPLVFVHGLSGSWPNWLEQLPVFAANHRVIAMDLPGFGHSPMPHERITISGYARLLDGLFDELAIGAATLVGNSMGGFVSAELAIAFPERVERLVLVSPAGLSSYRNARGTRALPALHRAERIVAAYTAWMASKSDTVTHRPLLRNATLGFVTRHPTRLPGRSRRRAAARRRQARLHPGPRSQPRLRPPRPPPRDRLPHPDRLGRQDRVITVRDADVYAELIPGSRKVVYPDTGHMSQLERPEAFNALLRDFLGE